MFGGARGWKEARTIGNAGSMETISIDLHNASHTLREAMARLPPAGEIFIRQTGRHQPQRDQ